MLKFSGISWVRVEVRAGVWGIGGRLLDLEVERGFFLRGFEGVGEGWRGEGGS